jgi:hypothetical protein
MNPASLLRPILPLAIAAAVITSCDSGRPVSDQVAEAEMAMAASDVASTRRICDQILSDSVAKGSITATELARLSILYMQLNELTDDHEAVDLAADCYREAFQANPDSARMFYQELPVGQDKYVMTLSSIVHSMDNPKQLDGYSDESHEFADSIATDSE